jgi:anti-anti-sigma factor
MSKLDISITVIADKARVICSGRIVAGKEVEELALALSRVLTEVETLELDLRDVSFLDSAGIGVLVRTLVQTRIYGKRLKFVALSAPVRKTLEITNLLSQFTIGGPEEQLQEGMRVLFVHPSHDVRTFVDALLRQRGANPQTCASIYDARLLAEAFRIDLVIVPAELDSSSLSEKGLKVLKLEKDFFSARAEEAGDSLIARVRAA